MKISVIVPAYNCAQTIKNTIDSLLASGIRDPEIVIVDDGSDDGTGEICDEAAEEHACVRCIHQENAGVSAARNRGLREASGEYVWFVDADDSIDADSASRVEEILETYAPDMLVFGMRFDFYHKGRVFRSDEMLPPVDGMRTAAECGGLLYALYTANSLSSLCSRIIKRSVVEGMSTRLREDMFLYEDLEFTLRVMRQCGSVYFFREPVYRYRLSEEEANAGRRIRRIEHIPELLSKIEEALAGAAETNRILLSLYLTLATERIRVSSTSEIESLCGDFRGWIDGHGLLDAIVSQEYPMRLYNGEVRKLIAKRRYSKIRHRVANWIKWSIGDFRKW